MKKSQILPFEYEITDQPITGMGGLPIFLAAAKKLGVEKLFTEHLAIKLRKRGYTEFELSMAIILTLLAGGEGLDDVDKIRMDEIVSGGRFPTPPRWGISCGDLKTKRYFPRSPVSRMP